MPATPHVVAAHTPDRTVIRRFCSSSSSSSSSSLVVAILGLTYRYRGLHLRFLFVTRATIYRERKSNVNDGLVSMIYHGPHSEMTKKIRDVGVVTPFGTTNNSQQKQKHHEGKGVEKYQTLLWQTCWFREACAAPPTPAAAMPGRRKCLLDMYEVYYRYVLIPSILHWQCRNHT